MSTAASLPPSDTPLIPLPALVPNQLREAVMRLAPGRMTEFQADLDQASSWAVEQSSIAPLRVFGLKWGMVVAIERIPSRAARFHALEARTGVVDTREEARAVNAELRAILDEAEREIAG
ncbi:hypothetical protein [Streptacidiphilus rugosus]|uniref:hypothetical protein n=1 Tax=Streptacidiphilus rugosus TaxID=405783 RepID=UPI00056B1AB5|nr:hypothetical protein [Streptacidiphilus rugosus]